MANATPSHLGIANNLSHTAWSSASYADKNALFLKVFSNEILATFNAATVLRERTRVRTIQAGKSASFAAIGKTVAEYHTPGEEILGNNVLQDEIVVTIDDMLIAHTFISNYEEAKNHYDVRAEFSTQMGQALAQTYDRNLFGMAGSKVFTPGSGIADQGVAERINLDTDQAGAGNTTTNTTSDIIDGLYLARQKFDEKNVTGEIFCYVSPKVYYALVQNDKILNRDFLTSGNGDYANANILRVAGMPIIMTNNMAVDHGSTANVAKYPDFQSKYGTDMSDVLALCMHRDALGTVQLMGLATEAQYDIRRQGQLAVARMAVGHGVIREEGIIGVTGTFA
jgi:hypothetical protein